MQYRMNKSIKFRESFRPFAPAVLRDHVSTIFEVPATGVDSPYMLFVAPVKEAWRLPIRDEDRANLQSDDIMKRLAVCRSKLQSITHVDYSARLQSVDEERHGRYYRLISRFHQMTGVPVIVNTSFNVASEPIVATPEDAFHCFMKTDIDVLVMENALLFKAEQPAGLKEHIVGSF
jgi:carbamoyltransferase